MIYVIGILAVTNIITIFLATKPFSTGIFGSNDGAEVASVGKVTIERQQLRDKLEERYGEEVLSDLIDEEVIRQVAEQYDISVSDEELELELVFIKTKYGSYNQQYLINNEDWEEQIRNQILLEKILVHNVEISNTDIETVYNQNKEHYKVPTAYHLSLILVESKKKANQLYDELNDGASFSVLALEQSIDAYSSTLGGDIGYITKSQQRYPASYYKKASKLDVGEWSKPFQVDDQYAIIYVQEKVVGKQYRLKEVKSMIQRQLAVEQIDGQLTAEYFWNEFDVQWLYN